MIKTKAEMVKEFDRLGAEFDALKGHDPKSDEYMKQLEYVIEQKQIINAKREILLWAMNIKY